MKTTDWNSADWKLPDSEIARMFGLSRERVRQKRKALKVGRSPMWHRVLRCAKASIAAADCSGMSAVEVARMAKCGEAYAVQALKELGKPYLKGADGRRGGKYRWSSISEPEWRSLPDRRIARMLGVRNVGVVSQWRIRHGLIKSSRKMEKTTA